MQQRDYWDRAAHTKVFTHPLDMDWMARHAPPPRSRILDYGCGQGRLCRVLQEAGYAELLGVDFSPVMVERAAAAVPQARFAVLADGTAGLEFLNDGSVDGVLLFAVLTCIPDDAAQRAVVAQLRRVLRPRGMLYVSDYLLQTDARSLERYARQAAAGRPYGVFDTDDGATVRHHRPAWLEALFTGWRKTEEAEVEIATMNGHRATAWQALFRRPGRSGPGS